MSRHLLNPEKYGCLLATTRPHVVRSDEDLERFTALLPELDERRQPTSEEEELAELLTALVEQYEAEHYALPEATPVERIQFLLEQRGQSRKDLWPVIGSKGSTSDILAGKRGIGPTVAARLGEFFGVAPRLFINWG